MTLTNLGIDNAINSAMSNMTGIPFDLNKNYTQEVSALIGLRLVTSMCNNQEKQTGIELEVLKYRCDLFMKQLRDQPNITAPQIETRTFEDCYSSWINLGIFMSLSYPIEIDRDVKQFFANYCNDMYDTYGIWINALDKSEIMQHPQYAEKFSRKYYYPLGIPNSVMNFWDSLGNFWEVK